MITPAKKERLVALINDELSVAIPSQTDDYIDIGFLESAKTHTVRLKWSDLEKYEISYDDAKKIVWKLSYDKAIIIYEFGEDFLEVTVNVERSKNFVNFAHGSKFIFIQETGQAYLKNKKTIYKPGTKEYKLLNLLNSNRNHYFSYEEISKAIGDKDTGFAKKDKKPIQILVRDVKAKLKTDGDKTDKESFIKCKNGYCLID